jgi:hypothetical protein
MLSGPRYACSLIGWRVCEIRCGQGTNVRVVRANAERSDGRPRRSGRTAISISIFQASFLEWRASLREALEDPHPPALSGIQASSTGSGQQRHCTLNGLPRCQASRYPPVRLQIYVPTTQRVLLYPSMCSNHHVLLLLLPGPLRPPL